MNTRSLSLALLLSLAALPAAAQTIQLPTTPLPLPLPPITIRISPLFQADLNDGPSTLRGFVDLHAHPMSYLGFGGKVVHGAPDVGLQMPAGDIYNPAGVGVSGSTCNESPRDAASIAEALGTCYSTHQGHDFITNKCGDDIRRLVLNGVEDANGTNKPHDEPHPPGYPAFNRWPRFDDIMHQQMWIDWIKRSYDGGMRVMVALAVNNVTLAHGVNGNQPYDDKTVGNTQIDQMIRLVGRHSSWMQIAHSAAELRTIVGNDKLAIILGTELDDIGNFGAGRRVPTAAEVRAEIQRLYKKGVRYVFPVHVVDNYFGGTAIYQEEFVRATRYEFGQWPSLVCATASDDITTRFGGGFDAAYLASLGEAGGDIPTPTCGAGLGFKNARGLQPAGQVALDELMRLGMLIDVDHASQTTVQGIINYTNVGSSSTGYGYPLISGHNGLRASSSENTRTASQYNTIASRKGVAGIGWGDSSAPEWISNVRRALAAAPGLAINLGSDIDGLAIQPRPVGCEDGTCVVYSDSFPQARMPDGSGSTRAWDYNTEGVAHVGLFPDFLRHVERLGATDLVDKVFQGAENLANTWEHAEVIGGPLRDENASFTSVTATVRVTDDDIRDGSQAWLRVNLRDGRAVEAEITNLAKGGNVARAMSIALGGTYRVTDVVSIAVRKTSNDCLFCTTDYWNGSVILESAGGMPILATPDFHIGAESLIFPRT